MAEATVTADTTTTTATDTASTTTTATDKGTTAAPPPEKKDAATTATTTATDKGATDTTTTTDKPAGWGENWRQEYSADEKVQKRLERYQSPKAVIDALIAAQNKISSGELKASVPFPAKGTDEEKAAWRTENGVPAKVEDYDLKFDDGTTIAEHDKPMVDEYLKAVHEINMPAGQAKASVAAYLKIRDKQIADMEAKDAEVRRENEDTLRAEWGADYRKNLNLIDGLLSSAPNGLKDRLANRRTADGVPFGNDVDALRWMADLARQINPVASVVPGEGSNMASAIDTEIAAIEKTMKTDRKAYNADAKMQARYQELLGAQDRLKKQGR